MEPMYKVGDKVHVVNTLDEDMPMSVAEEMRVHEGKIVTISKVFTCGRDCSDEYKPFYDEHSYNIEEDDIKWTWTSPMFEESYFHVGDLVKIIEDLEEGSGKEDKPYGVFCNSIMAEHAGEVCKIIEIIKREGEDLYRLDIPDCTSFRWTNQMFTKYKEDDKCRRSKLKDEHSATFSTSVISITGLLKS